MEILITPQEACQLWPRLEKEWPEVRVRLAHGEIHDSRKLGDLLAKVDAVILGIEKIDREVLKDARSLKIISRFGVGCDTIDPAALQERGIRLTNTPGAMALGVARHTLSLLLAMTANLKEHWKNLENNQWLRLDNAPFGEITLGVVGMGAIGKEVAKMALALGFTVLGWNRSDFLLGGVAKAASLEQLIDAADVVSLHLPLTPETHHLFQGKILDRLKGKSLINVSRGGLVDEADLLQRLENGELKHYAADVFEQEPLKEVSLQLARHPRVIATPHVAAKDQATAFVMLKQAMRNAVCALQGNHQEVKAYVV